MITSAVVRGLPAAQAMVVAMEGLEQSASEQPDNSHQQQTLKQHCPYRHRHDRAEQLPRCTLFADCHQRKRKRLQPPQCEQLRERGPKFMN
ncbi:hypothetical protein D3C75_969840 [compost metagenome]